MQTTQKSIEIARYLKEELASRTGLTVALSFEVLSADVSDAATRYPVLLVGDDVGTHAGCRVVVKPIEWPLAKDVLGLQSPVYTPDEILVGFEAPAAGPVEATSLALKLQILGALVLQGTRVSIFESATTDFFDTADFTTANLKGTFEDIKYPMIKSQ